jgi:catechol 2,3-dioxygenase-like lactoylglutathione lyase family enzyme
MVRRRSGVRFPSPALPEGTMPSEVAVQARLAYVSMYVRSVADSRRFYADLLGLAVLSDEEWGCVLDAKGIQLFLHPTDGDDRQPIELTFDVDDADAAVTELTTRGVPLSEPVTGREWGDRDGAVLDPDQNVVYLRSKRSS